MEYVNEITKLELTEEEFDNLIFMGPPPIWRNEVPSLIQTTISQI